MTEITSSIPVMFEEEEKPHWIFLLIIFMEKQLVQEMNQYP